MIVAQGLRKSYGDFEAVKGIDVEVRKGEAFGFLGPNGAGKSSTMRMIAAVSPGDRRLAADPRHGPGHPGFRRSGRGSASARRRTRSTTSCGSHENLVVYGRYFGLSRAEASARADELLDFVQLTEKAKAKVEDLSGGMKRRLTIARSLINQPDLLLLDEPTTGLDPQARHQLWDRLFRLKQQGVTLVLTTHYMDEAEQLCDRLVVMDDGVIVAEGSPPELIARALDPRGHRAALRRRRARGDGRARSPTWPSASRCCPTGCCSTPTTARRPRSPSTSAGCARCRRWCAAPRSRTSSSGSPAGAWSTDAMLEDRRAHAHPAGACAYWVTVYKRTWQGTVVTSFVMPFLYLAAMGVGLGTLRRRQRRTGRALGGVTLPGVHRSRAARDHRDADRRSARRRIPSWAGSSGTGSTSRWRPPRSRSPTSSRPSWRSCSSGSSSPAASSSCVLALYGAVGDVVAGAARPGRDRAARRGPRARR